MRNPTSGERVDCAETWVPDPCVLKLQRLKQLEACVHLYGCTRCCSSCWGKRATAVNVRSHHRKSGWSERQVSNILTTVAGISSFRRVLYQLREGYDGGSGSQWPTCRHAQCSVETNKTHARSDYCSLSDRWLYWRVCVVVFVFVSANLCLLHSFSFNLSPTL